ncbi:ABC transporter permease [Spiroplasma diminutum]|uniref:Uncharacterized protein n=1 Tax=Spiroplasma diminutum CUAS-1 TaxID=1276221 RepID=S5LZ27_9MOLU|nr:ABC transporter permease [Spiroplasma diminutum]AGR41811.1 hypothetical protein SDIMI_v3c01070 [Spiroplasma diminutum CUAS-1]
MSEVKLNLTKIKNSNEKKILNNSENKFNGFKTLYLINLKRLIRNKAVITMTIISLVVTFIMSSLVASFMKDPSNAESIGTIMISITYICEIFFFIIFMIILSTELIKKQLLEGIQNIEIRSGVSFKKSFLLRWYVFMTFVFSLALLNAILKISLTSTIIFKFDLTSFAILSSCIFFFFIGFVWTPVVFAITILCSMTWSIMLNVFITLILVFSGMASSVEKSINYDNTANNEMVMKTNLKAAISSSFYKNMKNDVNVNKIFNDNDESGESKLGNQLQKNASGIPIIDDNEIKSTSIYFYENPNFVNNDIKIIYQNSLYSGLFNVKYELDEKIYAPLENTEIFNLLNEIFMTVKDGMESNNNKPPLSLPGYNGGYMDRYGYDSKFHDLEPLIKWLSKQEKTKQYKNLLNWVNNLYSKYKFALINNKYYNYYDSNGKDQTYQPLLIISDFNLKGSSDWNPLEDPINKEINKVYKRYPELRIINNLVTEAWIGSMVWRAEYKYSDRYNPSSSYSSFNNPQETYENYQKWTNKSIIGNSLNIFNHFSIINSQLIGNNLNKDLLFKQSFLSYTGITTGYSNLSDLAKVDSRLLEGNQELKPIFETVKLKKKSGFLVPVAFLMYILISTGFMYLIFLLWAKKAKI